jgi:hypothetical protein
MPKALRARSKSILRALDIMEQWHRDEHGVAGGLQ